MSDLIVVEQRLAELETNIRFRTRRILRDLVDIGRWLIEARGLLVDGAWGDWLTRLDLEPRMANHWIHVAQRFDGASEIFSDLSATALLLLAAPSVLMSALHEVEGRLEAGEHLPVSTVRELIDKHKVVEAAPVITQVILDKAESMGDKAALSYTRSLSEVTTHAAQTGAVDVGEQARWLTMAVGTTVQQTTDERQQGHIDAQYLLRGVSYIVRDGKIIVELYDVPDGTAVIVSVRQAFNN